MVERLTEKWHLTQLKAREDWMTKLSVKQYIEIVFKFESECVCVCMFVGAGVGPLKKKKQHE